MSTTDRSKARLRRHRRVRKSVTGTEARPRLAVFRSAKHISAQVIDDSAGRTVAAASSVQAGVADGVTGIAAATEVGRVVAERAREAGIATVVFDRGGYKYHGRVAALADAARDAGLEF
ncbi:MAG: 50S ribosomal protein L18 [Acidimicrobiaceae bacterium]|nr:50S ribosomal protein L18 [Acidimicrobiaceae bacterium]